MRQFLQYWRTYNPEKEYDTPLNFAASGQFKRVQIGDVLWIVALREHRLTLLGRLVVGDVVGRKDAVKRLGKNIYGAALYALSKPGTERDIIEADIQTLAPLLRFNSSQDRLSLSNHTHTEGKQLQALRELTPESSSSLQRLLDSVTQTANANHESEEAAAISQERAAGFQSDIEIRMAVENFAMSKAKSVLVSMGYEKFENTAKFKPYDYTCERGGKHFFVEVKGTQTAGKTLILTRGEVEHIRSHADECILVLVRSVSVSGKGTIRVSGGTAEVKESWSLRSEDLSPIQYAWTVS
jgi:hypothetical protein